MKTIKWILCFVLLAGSLAACDWTDDDDHDDHADAWGLVLVTNGEEIVRVENAQATGQITVAEGEESDHIAVFFLDEDGDRIDPNDYDDDHFLEWEIDDESVAALEQDAGDRWDFHIHGEQTGTTTLTLRLMHNPDDPHADFTAAGIPIEVTAPEVQ